MTEAIERQKVVEIYNLFDGLHSAVIRAAVCLNEIDRQGIADAINEADRRADEMEGLFSEILTPEERGDDGT